MNRRNDRDPKLFICGQVVSRYVRCVLGEEYPLCSDSFRVEFCKTLTDSCHLNNWNKLAINCSTAFLTGSRMKLITRDFVAVTNSKFK